MLVAIYLMCSALLLWRGMFYTINQMGRGTALCPRLAWLMVTTSALAVTVGPIFGRWPAPTWEQVALLVALTIYLLWRGDAQFFEGEAR